MQTETFLQVDEAKARQLFAESSSAQIEQRKARLADLGFDSLRRVETEIAPQLDMASTLWPELRGSTLKLWRKFLPTSYRIREFKFSSIPDEALDAIELAQQAGCFDEIIIWTPEGNKLMGRMARKRDAFADKVQKVLSSVDPMAVGVVSDPSGVKRYFSIARWGESLWSVKKIKGYVSLVNWQARILGYILPAIAIVVGVGFYAAGIMTFGIDPMIGWTFATIVGLVVAALLLTLVLACIFDI